MRFAKAPEPRRQTTYRLQLSRLSIPPPRRKSKTGRHAVESGVNLENSRSVSAISPYLRHWNTQMPALPTPTRFSSFSCMFAARLTDSKRDGVGWVCTLIGVLAASLAYRLQEGNVLHHLYSFKAIRNFRCRKPRSKPSIISQQPETPMQP